jgi:hypothetical protein
VNKLTLKAWASALFTVLSVLVPMVSVGPLTPTEWTNVGLLALNTILVQVVPNLTETTGKYAKAFVTTGTAIGTLLVSFFADGSYHISSGEWIQIAAVVLAALGVYRAPAPQWQGPAVSPGQVRAIEDPRP